MAGTPQSGDDKSAAKAERFQAREQRRAKRSKMAAAGGRSARPARLCSLSTVEVKKSDQGYVVMIAGSARRYKFAVTPQEVGTILRDLETAIQVIRNQH